MAAFAVVEEYFLLTKWDMQTDTTGPFLQYETAVAEGNKLLLDRGAWSFTVEKRYVKERV